MLLKAIGNLDYLPPLEPDLPPEERLEDPDDLPLEEDLLLEEDLPTEPLDLEEEDDLP